MKRRLILIVVVMAALGLLWALAAQRKTAAPVKQAFLSADLPVQVVPVIRRRLETNLVRTGTILASNDVMVISETVGRVLAVHADVGDRLRAGAVLAKIDDELKLAAFRTAEVAMEKAGRDQARFVTLVDQKSATSSELEGVRLAFKAAEAQYMAARRQYQDCEIKTPIAGVVAARYINVGSTVAPGTSVANVVDLSKLKIILNVSEKEAYALKTGDPVTVSVDVYPGTPFPASIRNIGSKADDGHSFPVEVSLTNSEERPLRAGLFARVHLGAGNGRDILAIPRAALIGSVRLPSVFVVENGIARRRQIVLGDEDGGVLEVREGLKEKDLVVVDGQNNLKDGAAVKIVS
jgi:RND family efflux transporter MFP subunit